jgi:chorismate mutase
MEEELKSYRNQIDFIDSKILFYLRERIILSNKIGNIKHKLNSDIYNENREKEILNNLYNQNSKMKETSIANPFKIAERFIKVIWETIFNHSKYIQEK